MYQHKKIIFYFSVMTLIILLPVCILLIGELDKRISEYKSNIITEIRDGKIIDNNKDVLKIMVLKEAHLTAFLTQAKKLYFWYPKCGLQKHRCNVMKQQLCQFRFFRSKSSCGKAQLMWS